MLNTRWKICHAPSIAVIAMCAMAALPAATAQAADANAAASATAMPGSAADATADAPAQTLTDIVVTARKRPENSKNVPIAITVVSGKTLSMNHQYQLEDLNTLAPSVNISFFNPRGSYVAVRGLGNNPASDGLESSVGIFIDGVYLGRPGMAVFDMNDIDQIELLRGPQGTLFGKNTSAGALTITTAEPSLKLGGNIEGSVGNYNYLQTRGSLTGTVIPDLVAARASFYVTSRTGWVTDPQTGQVSNGSHRQGGRLQFLITPAPSLRIRLIGEYNHEGDDCCALVLGSTGPAGSTALARIAAAGGSAVIGSSNYMSLDNTANRMDIHQAAATSLITYDTGNLTLSSITGWRNWNYRALYDADSSSAQVYKTASASPTHDWQFSQEFRIANRKGGKIDVTAGLYYFQQQLRSRSDLEFGATAANYLAGSATPAAAYLVYDNLTEDTFANVWTHSYAAYAQATWHVTPGLDLTGGLRGTYERKTAGVERPANAAQTAYDGALETAGFDPSGTASLNYKITPHVSLYATYSRGAKAGGINPVVPSSLITTAQLIVKPETTDNYEAGVKSILLGNTLRINADMFYEKVRNYQANYYAGTPQNSVSILSNVGNVTSWGSELEIDFIPLKGLDLNATGSYNNATYDNYTNAPCAPEKSGTICDLSGYQLANAPRWIGNVGAEYTFDVGARMQTSFGGQVSYKGHFYGNQDDSVYSILGNYTVVNVNAGVSWPDAGWEARFWMKNALNSHHLETYPSGGTGYYGAYFGTVADPQTFGVTVKKTF